MGCIDEEKSVHSDLRERKNMKTLILNGSPRAEGNTVGLINIICHDVLGDYLIVNTYKFILRNEDMKYGNSRK